MEVSQAKSKFLKIMSESGVEESVPNPHLIWESFKEFARLPVDYSDDALLFQVGCYRFTGELLFYLDFVRQFRVEDAQGDYHHMEQLHVEFTHHPDHVLETIKSTVWSHDVGDLDSFFSVVESLSEFKIAENYHDWALNVYQEQI